MSALLVPGIKLLTPREQDPRAAEADHAYAQKRIHVLQRDRYRCTGCGFPAPPDREALSGSLAASGYLEVHHADNDHQNNDDVRNLVSLCPFCHTVHHIGFAGAHRRATLIWLPWLSQERVNLLCNLCGVVMARSGERLPERARQLYDRMQALVDPLEESWGKGTGDPSILAGALGILHKQCPELYLERGKALNEIRVLPTLAAFKEAVTWWSEHTWLPGEQWEVAWETLAESV